MTACGHRNAAATSRSPARHRAPGQAEPAISEPTDIDPDALGPLGLADFQPRLHLPDATSTRARLWNVLIGFDGPTAEAAATTLVSGFTSRTALTTALATARAHALRQDDTVGNIRTRATAVLGAATIAVTLASSLGLLAIKTTDPGTPLVVSAAWAILTISLVLLLVNIGVQRPLTWTFDAGTNYLQAATSPDIAQARELVILEIGIQRNTAQLSRLFLALNLMNVALVAAPAVVVLVLLDRIT